MFYVYTLSFLYDRIVIRSKKKCVHFQFSELWARQSLIAALSHVREIAIASSPTDETSFTHKKRAECRDLQRAKFLVDMPTSHVPNIPN